MAVKVGEPLSFDDIARVAREDEEVTIAPGVLDGVNRARAVVERAVDRGTTVYGITTGFGGLANVRIPADEAERLQRDLVRSHATAVGPSLDREVVRATLLLKARTFAFGVSGVRPVLLERLVAMLNAR